MTDGTTLQMTRNDSSALDIFFSGGLSLSLCLTHFSSFFTPFPSTIKIQVKDLIIPLVRKKPFGNMSKFLDDIKNVVVFLHISFIDI